MVLHQLPFCFDFVQKIQDEEKREEFKKKGVDLEDIDGSQQVVFTWDNFAHLFQA